MNSPHDQRIAELVHAVRVRTPEERTAYLEEACGDDTSLRIEVEQIVARSTVSDRHADSTPPGTDAPTQRLDEEVTVSVPPPMCISSYKVLGVLGEGSMGVVYRAEQDNPHRVVALKVLKAGGVSTRALRRFEHEAQMLGRLQHPGIAQIFEAGTANTGYGPQPFFAMELIQGVPLTEYADSQRLSTRERLALLVKVCDGVEHAHQKGVIHRDLKPGNILVDESGQPKILDFGIALATDPDMEAATLQTDLKQLAGTVPYMSFEQVKGDPRELDTRTDVYALGVTAYQLLTSHLPYDLKHKTIPEAVRIIGEQEPKQLGTIDRRFRGDVETIIAKALEKDKTRRYQSASEFASDVRRFLSDEPILARPPSAMYQFGKFARRNRTLVGGVAGMFVMLLLAVVGTSIGLTRAVEAEAVAKQQYLEAGRARDSAAKEAEKATAIGEFLDRMLASADPVELGKDVTVREALDQAAMRIEHGSLAGQPEVESAVLVTLGKTYRSLGFLDAAEPHLLSALEINRRVLGNEHRQTLTSMNEYALLLMTQGRLPEAETLYRQTFQSQRRILGEKHLETLETLHNLAGLLQALGEFPEAESLYRRALATECDILGEEHRNTLITRNNLAALLEADGRLFEAELLYRKTLEAQLSSLGPKHPDTLSSMNNLATLLKAEGKLLEAEPFYRQALDTRQLVLGNEHPSTLASMNNLAGLLKAEGKLPEATDLYRQTLGIRRRTLGDDHPSTLTSMNNLAASLKAEDKLDEAGPLYRQTLETRRRILGDDHPKTLASMNNLATLFQAQGKLREAERLYRETADLLRRKLGDDHPNTITSIFNLANVLEKQGDYTEAELLHREALELQRRVWPEGHPNIAVSLIRVGMIRMQQGDPVGAEPFLRECLAIRSDAYSEGDWRTANAESVLGDCLTTLHRFSEAEPLLVRSYPIIKAKWGDSDERSQRAVNRSIHLYDVWGKPDKAAEYRAMLPESANEPASEKH